MSALFALLAIAFVAGTLAALGVLFQDMTLLHRRMQERDARQLQLLELVLLLEKLQMFRHDAVLFQLEAMALQRRIDNLARDMGVDLPSSSSSEET